MDLEVGCGSCALRGALGISDKTWNSFYSEEIYMSWQYVVRSETGSVSWARVCQVQDDHYQTYRYNGKKATPPQ